MKKRSFRVRSAIDSCLKHTSARLCDFLDVLAVFVDIPTSGPCFSIKVFVNFTLTGAVRSLSSLTGSLGDISLALV
jgi:hypothetical protein